jgi:hypothetical protein
MSKSTKPTILRFHFMSVAPKRSSIEWNTDSLHRLLHAMRPDKNEIPGHL